MRSRIAMALALGLLGTAAHAQSEPNTQGTYYINKSFAVSWAYPFIKLDTAYNRGWTGKGVTVAVFDTGLDVRNIKFSGNLAGGYDIYTGGAVTTDPNWHGTFVSSIIAANRQATTTLGMYGVASDAKIYAVRVMDANGVGSFTDRQLANGINAAVGAGSKVFNNSWNTNVMLSQLSISQRQAFVASIPQQLNAYAVASAKGVINVWAAGNNGLSSPGYYATLPELDARLKGSWLVAVAVDTNGQIASWSNRCGIAASYCLAAPGGSIVGVYQGGVALASGTSFAAPMVSGGAALLLQEWPYLTGAQITSILLRTANKTGVYANSSIYGAGLMDLDAATRPVGTAVIPKGSTVNGSNTVLASSAVTLGPAFGAVASHDDVLVLDDYGRAYGIGLQNMVQTASSGINTVRAMSRWQGMSTTTALADGMSLGLVDDASRGDESSDDLLVPALGTPYMAMGDGTKIALHIHGFTTWASQQQMTTDDPSYAVAAIPSVQGMAYRWQQLDLGIMAEQNSLFGYATGQNGLGANAVTAFADLHDNTDIGLGWSADWSIGAGYTQVQHNQGFITGVSGIASMNAGFGLSHAGGLMPNDRFGFAVSLPTTVISGTADVNIPVSRDFDGNITYQTDRLDLSGSANKQDLQAYWRADLGHGSSIGISTAVMLRENTVADALTLASFKLRF